MVSSEDSSDTCSTAACVRGVCVLFACARLSYLDLLALLRPATHRTEYVGVRVQNLGDLGFRPTAGLSAEFERWAMLSDSFGGVHPNQVYATLEIRACSVTLVHPCRED